MDTLRALSEIIGMFIVIIVFPVSVLLSGYIIGTM